MLTAILLPVLFGCLGIGYDVGNIYMHKARLQNVADAAALAGGRAYLQSQLDSTGKEKEDDDETKGKPDDSKDYTGRDNGIVYRYNSNNQIDRSSSPHKEADEAADTYISKNIVNLGNTVYADKFSHYALRGEIKDATAETAVPNEIFYRIGLYEDVPLRFLPLITNKFSGRVRAGAVALVVPGTPGTESGNPASKDNSGVTSPSIFDNLFTFSEWLFTRNLTLNDGTVEASFEGTMVYTHLNNTADDPSSLYTTLQPSRYFHYEADNGSASDEFQYTHMYENAIGSNVSTSKGVINDPYINTFYDTKAYLDAFKSKLNGPHVDVSEANASYSFNVSGDGNVNVKCRCKLNGTENYRLENNIYYLLDNSDNDVTFEENGKTYTVCYCPFSSSGKYMRCGKNADDSKYYILNENGNISNCYIVNGNTPMISLPEGEKYLGMTWDNKLKWGDQIYWQPDNQILTLDQLKPKVNLAASVSREAFVPVTFEATTSNVYHLLYRRLDDPNQIHDTVEIVINDPIPGEDLNKPVYVLVEGVNQVKILGSANMTTGRPLILVFLSEGTTQLKYEYTGNFYGTIYAPVSTFEHAKGSGSFTGNIIAKTINIQSSTKIAWKQENHLEKYEYEKDALGNYVLDENGNKKIKYNYVADSNGDYLFVNGAYRKAEEGEQGTHKRVPVYAYLDQAIKTVSDETAAKIEKENQDLEKALQEQNTTLEEFTEDIYTKLGLSKDEIVAAKADSNWYNNQTFGRKKTLYTKWRALYDSYPANSPLRNLLWPWNEHFGIDPEEEEIEATPETLRLINYRTEFQLKETMNNDDVVDPFIFETLRQPNSY